MVFAYGAVSNPVVGAVVEDDAVDKALDEAGAFVLLSCDHASNGSRHVHVKRTGKECAACAKTKFGGNERTLNRSERRRFADEALR